MALATTPTHAYSCSEVRDLGLHVSINLDPRTPEVLGAQIACLELVRAKILLAYALPEHIAFGSFFNESNTIQDICYVVYPAFLYLQFPNARDGGCCLGDLSAPNPQKTLGPQTAQPRVPTYAATLLRSIAPSAVWISSTNFFVRTPNELKYLCQSAMMWISKVPYRKQGRGGSEKACPATTQTYRCKHVVSLWTFFFFAGDVPSS